MERRSSRARAARHEFAAAVVEHGDWRRAAQARGARESTARKWMGDLAPLFRSQPGGGVPHAAPPAMGPLLGRARELDAVLHAFETRDVRCVSLFGAPGVGKTRLAVEAATRLWVTGERAVFIELGAARDAADIVRAISDALAATGLDVAADGDSLAAYFCSAAASAPLLILDDVDGVRTELPQLVQRWLAASEHLELLVTSRITLDGACGEAISVAPLNFPRPEDDAEIQRQSPAIRLFVMCAPPWIPRADLYSRSADLARIVRALDGIPAHIREAAGALTTLGLDTLVTGIGRPLQLLGAHDDAGECTARSRVRWSWGRLTAVERSIVAACSVFEAEFAAAAAAAVTRRPVLEVSAALHSAVACGFAFADGSSGPTYFRLAAVGREVSRQHAATLGCWQSAVECHARYYADRAGEWLRDNGRLKPRQHAEISVVTDDLEVACARAANGLVAPQTCLPIARAAAHCPTDMPLATVRSMVEQLLARRAELPAYDRAGLLLAHGSVLRVQGHLTLAARQLTAARRLARDAGWSAGSVKALTAHARLQLTRRRVTKARWFVTQSLAEARDLGVPYLVIDALMCLGDVESAAGQFGQALQTLQEAQTLAVQSDLPGLAARVLTLIGCVAWFVQDRGAAEDAWLSSLTMHTSSGDQVGIAKATYNLTMVDIAAGNIARARRAAERVSALCLSFGDPVLSWCVESTLAVALREAQELVQAEQHAHRAVTVFDGTELHFPRMYALAARGVLLADVGRVSAARADWAAAKAIATDLDVRFSPLSLTWAHIELAQVRASNLGPVAPAAQGARARARDAVGRLADSPDAVGLEAELRIVQSALEDSGERVAVIVDEEGAWFQVPGAVPVDLTRRPVLSQLLRLLLNRRIERPADYVTRSALLDAAWPLEKSCSESSLRNRLHVAIARLRKLGLDTVLLSGAQGYRLSPDVEFHMPRSDAPRFTVRDVL